MKKNILQFIAVISLLLTAFRCEDDPLLDPDTGEEEPAGSYGNLALPGESDSIKITNPEIF